MSPLVARPAGDAALLITMADDRGTEAGSAALAAAIVSWQLAGVLDVVPGARTVLVISEPGRGDLADLARRILSAAPPAGPEPGAGLEPGAGPEPGKRLAGAGPVEIPVIYDGPDLAEVAELTGLTVQDIIARHQAAEYRVGWLGFAPGFGYLTGLDPALAVVPRRDSPRPSVPAGSVAIAGGLAAVYPAASPGGWQLIGRTPSRLWDPQREPPALLTPGLRVRFRAAGGESDADVPAAGGTEFHDHERLGGTGDAYPSRSWSGPLEVVRPGPLATIQDLGRPGYAHLGVPPSGAADAASLRRANRLVGNDDGAAGLELTLGRALLRFHAEVVVALTGAPVPARLLAPGEVTPGGGPRGDGSGGPAGAGGGPAGEEVLTGAPVAIPAGWGLRLGAPGTGLRSYLAVSGGIDVPAVLGSRSRDVLSGLGPRPLRAGDRLPVGAARALTSTSAAGWPDGTGQAGETSGAGWAAAGRVDEGVWLRIVAGPRDDWFGPGGLRLLTRDAYQVQPDSNRTGLRLAGAGLSRIRAGELPSEGMVTGAIQVPPDGQPILLLADHPTTGGYPVIAVVHSADVGRAAQLRPGQRLRFTLAANHQ